MTLEEQLSKEAEARIYECLKTCSEQDKTFFLHQLERVEQIRRTSNG